MPVRTATARWEGGLKDGKGSIRLGGGAFEGQYSFSSRFEDGVGGFASTPTPSQLALVREGMMLMGDNPAAILLATPHRQSQVVLGSCRSS